MTSGAQPQQSEWIGIDGKVLRGSSKTAGKQAVVHAIGHDSQCEKVQARQSGDQASEIPIVRQLLKDSGLEEQKVALLHLPWSATH